MTSDDGLSPAERRARFQAFDDLRAYGMAREVCIRRWNERGLKARGSPESVEITELFSALNAEIERIRKRLGLPEPKEPLRIYRDLTAHPEATSQDNGQSAG